MVEKTQQQFKQPEKKEEIVPSADSLVKNLKDHVEGNEPDAEKLVEEAKKQDVDMEQIHDVMDKIKRGKDPRETEDPNKVPSAHDLTKKKDTD